MSSKQCLIAIFCIIYAIIISCNSNYSGTISEVEFEVTGTLVKSDGNPAQTNVYLINAGKDNSFTDTLLMAMTDTLDGSYRFSKVSDTVHSFRIFSQQDSFFIAMDTIRGEDTLIDMGIDTLTLPGAIIGTISTEDGSSPLGIQVFIPALSGALCYADTNGYYEITNLPSNRFYTVYYKEYGYAIATVSDIFIDENDTVTIPMVTLKKNNSPKKPNLSYDTLNNIVLISWEQMSDSIPDGYIIFRKDSTLTAKYPTQLNENYLITDLPFLYADTLNYSLFSEKDTITFEYKIKGVFGDDHTPFSDAATVTAVISTKGGVFTKLQVDSSVSELQVRDSISLFWESRGSIDSISLFISIDSMNTWTNLANNIPNNGSFSFLVPATETEHCFFKIEDADVNHDSQPFFSKQYSIINLNPNSLIKNGSFDLGNTYWNGVTVTDSGANAIFTFNNNCKISISEISNIESDIRLSQTEISLIKNSNYTLSFKASVNEDKNITFISCSKWTQEKGIIGYTKQNFTINPQQEVYSINFKMAEESDSTASIIFDVGESSVDITFDDIELFKK